MLVTWPSSEFALILVGLLATAFVTLRQQSARSWRDTAEANAAMLTARDKLLAEREVQLTAQDREIGMMRGQIDQMEHRVSDLASRPLAILQLTEQVRGNMEALERIDARFTTRHDAIAATMERLEENQRETIAAINGVERAVRERNEGAPR